MGKIFLRFPELSKKLGGRSRPSVFRDMRDRGFPRPVRIGVTAVAWDEGEVDQWLEERLAERNRSRCNSI